MEVTVFFLVNKRIHHVNLKKKKEEPNEPHVAHLKISSSYIVE